MMYFMRLQPRKLSVKIERERKLPMFKSAEEIIIIKKDLHECLKQSFGLKRKINVSTRRQKRINHARTEGN